MESFFASLKKELVHHEDYETREEAKTSLFEYVEVFYNKKRLHSSLGYMTPVAYEQAVIPGDQTKGHRIVPKLTLFGVVSTPCMVSGQESSS